MIIVKIIRAISGVLLVLQCAVLIALFGLLPLAGYSACPVKGNASNSIYKDGSLAFVSEVSPSDLTNGDIAFYYKGKTAVGSEIKANNKAGSSVTVGSGSVIPYKKISGKGSSFSVPLLGNYAEWLTNGSGLLASVIIMGVTFVIFAVSAFLVKEKD